MTKPLSVSAAIKIHCRECCNGHNPRTHCVSLECPLFPYKSGKKEEDIVTLIEDTKDLILRKNLLKNWEKKHSKEHFLSRPRLQAVKNRCKDCTFEGMVKKCEFEDCPLYPFRFGKNQNLEKKMVTPERKNVLLKNLQSSGRKK